MRIFLPATRATIIVVAVGQIGRFVVRCYIKPVRVFFMTVTWEAGRLPRRQTAALYGTCRWRWSAIWMDPTAHTTLPAFAFFSRSLYLHALLRQYTYPGRVVWCWNTSSDTYMLRALVINASLEHTPFLPAREWNREGDYLSYTTFS